MHRALLLRRLMTPPLSWMLSLPRTQRPCAPGLHGLSASSELKLKINSVDSLQQTSSAGAPSSTQRSGLLEGHTVTIQFRELRFLPSREDVPRVSVRFSPGLNVISGASDTGKSFLLEAMDFLLGAG